MAQEPWRPGRISEEEWGERLKRGWPDENVEDELDEEPEKEDDL